MKKIITIILLLILITFNYENKIITNKTNITDTKNEELGSIEIKEIVLRSEIKEGTDNNILNQNVVGHVKNSSLKFKETIILAGHNDTVFKGLYRLKKGSVIELTIYGNTQTYIVDYKKIIYDNDYTNFKSEKNKLILITCTEDIKKRLIIVAYLKV